MSEISGETDLRHKLEVCTSKLIGSYKAILKRGSIPEADKLGLEDSLHPFSISLLSESILSTCRTLLDIIQEMRVRASIIGHESEFDLTGNSRHN